MFNNIKTLTSLKRLQGMPVGLNHKMIGFETRSDFIVIMQELRLNLNRYIRNEIKV